MRKKIIIIMILIGIMLVIENVSFGAVEIVPSKNGTGKDQIVNTTVSNSFLLCRGMKDYGGSLYGTNVDPHLATNKDWGAVSYLSNSIYGTNTQGGNNGIQVTIDGVNYYSTTTNITGVMNWGSNPNTLTMTQTAGLINSYEPSSSSARDDVVELYNYRNTKYVEYINPTNLNETIGMASLELNSRFTTGVNNNTPTSIRSGLFGGTFSRSDGSITNYASGGPFVYNTFRPVIWN